MEQNQSLFDVISREPAGNPVEDEIIALEKKLGIRGSGGKIQTEDAVKQEEKTKEARSQSVQEILDSKLPTELPKKGASPSPAPTPGATPVTADGMKKNLSDNPAIQFMGGAADGIQSMVNAGHTLLNYVDNNFLEDKYIGNEKFDVVKDYIPKSDKGYNQLARGIGQFVVPFKGIGAAFNLAWKGKAVASIATDMLAFEGDQERLSNLIQSHPELQNPITEYLAAKPEDSEAEGRFKNALEGLALGGLVEGLFHGVKFVKNKAFAKKVVEEAEAVKSGAKVPPKTEPKVKPTEAPNPDAGINSSSEPLPDNVTPIKPGMDVSPPKPKGIPVERDLLGKIDVSADELLKSVDTSGKGGGIQLNLERIDADTDVESLIKNFAEKDKKALELRVKGTSSEKQLQLLAEELGIGAKEILQKRKGEAFNTVELYAARQIHIAAAEDLTRLAKVVSSGGSAEDKFKFLQAVKAYKAINMVVTGAKAEAGRVLNSLKISIKNDSPERAEFLKTVMDQVGEKNIEKMASRMAGMNVKDVSKIARKSAVRRISGAVYEVFVNKILSNPTTHAVNISSNTGTFYYRQTEKAIAPWIGSGIKELDPIVFKNAVDEQRALSKLDTSNMSVLDYQDHIDRLKELNDIIKNNLGSKFVRGEASAAIKAGTSEALNQVVGTISGAIDGIKALFRAKNLEEFKGMLSAPNTDVFTKTEGFAPAITSDELGGGVLMDLYGAAQRIPTKLLDAEDSFAKMVSYRAEVHSLSHRAGVMSGLSGKELQQFIEDFAKDPPDYIEAAAQKTARINTFTNPISNNFVDAVKYAREIDFGGLTPIRFQVPFVNTPMNIAKFSMERTPLALVSQNFQDALRKGGAARQEALTKVGLGSTIMGAMGVLAYKGLITGGPSRNYKSEKALDGAIEPHYSFKIGDDTYFPFDKFPVPLNSYLKLMADSVDIMSATDDKGVHKDISEMATLIGLSMVEAFGADSILDSFGGIFEAIESGDLKSLYKTPAAQVVSGLVPSMMIAPALKKEVDPLRRNMMVSKDDPTPFMSQVLNEIKNNIPGLSLSLPPRRNMFGEEMEIPKGMGLAAINPFYFKKFNSKDPLTKELARLGHVGPYNLSEDKEEDKHLNFAMPPQALSFEGISIDLTPQQYDKYVLYSAGIGLDKNAFGGKTLKETLTNIVKSDEYKNNTSDKIRKIILQKTIKGYRDAAKGQMFMEDPEFLKKIEKKASSKQGAFENVTSVPGGEE